MFPADRDYAIGDDAWIYVGNHQGTMTKGTVVAVLDLPGWCLRNYVVEVPTHIEPLLEVRSAFAMRARAPRETVE